MKSALATTLATKMTPSLAQEFQSRLNALLFVDYKDHVDEVLQGTLSRKSIMAMTYPQRYETPGAFGARSTVLKNFEEADAFVDAYTGPLDAAFLKKVHTIMMKGGVENLRPEALGVYRDLQVIGNALHWITAAQESEIENNVYLGFEKLQEQASPNGQQFLGKILYPDPSRVKPQALERIRNTAPDVYAAVIEYQANLQAKLREGPGKTLAIPKELTRKLVNALIEERLQWLTLKRDQIGNPDTPEKMHEYLAAGVQIEREVISIHPFENGNGRSTRELLYAYLRQQDIPPPRIVMTDDDIEMPLATWVAEIENGIKSTQRLYADLNHRIQIGYSLENAPDLPLPLIPDTHDVYLKTESKNPPEPRQAFVDPEQFLSYVKTRMAMDPNLAANLKTAPQLTLQSLNHDYVKWAQTYTLDYDHPKDGLKEIGLKFADPDYIDYLGNRAARSPEVWADKMKRWYRPDLIWRGLSYRDREVTEDEVLAMFRDFTPQLLSMHSVKARDGQDLLNSIRFDYGRYNQDLVTGDIYNMARDHHQTGPLYQDSYGFSTSKNVVVGKAFAMGAMVVAPYGQQMQFQHMLKSRVNIGMRRANSYVDLGRLHQLNKDFTYIYGRQQEVMGIGAADPDSVMTVLLYDAEGKVIQSYVRNPKEPSQVWVVRGEFGVHADKNGDGLALADEDSVPPQDSLMKTVDLYPGDPFVPPQLVPPAAVPKIEVARQKAAAAAQPVAGVMQKMRLGWKKLWGR